MFAMFLYIIIYYVCHRNDDKIYNQMRSHLNKWKEKITPKKEIDDAFLAEYRANYQKQRSKATISAYLWIFSCLFEVIRIGLMLPNGRIRRYKFQ